MKIVKLLSKITNIEIIAEGRSVRRRSELNQRFGRGNWKKLKGTATVEDEYGRIVRAEVHWYEAHGVGRRLIKGKRPLE